MAFHHRELPECRRLLRLLPPVLAAVSPHAVACGRTAAYLWGVDAYPLDSTVATTRPEVAVPPGVRGAARHGVEPRTEAIPEADRGYLAGVRLTTPARTAADLACRPSLFAAVAVIDRFLALGLSAQEIADVLPRHAGPRGVPTLRRALRLASPLAHSPPESWMRVLIHDAHLPAPRPQAPVTTMEGTFHLDLGWDDFRLAVEYDGVEFHRRDEQVRRDEWRRQAIRDVGWTVLPARIHDLYPRPGRFLERVLRHLTERGWEGTPGERAAIRRRIRHYRAHSPPLFP